MTAEATQVTDETGRPVNTCGHTAPRVTMPPRCCECGAFAHRAGEGFKVHKRLWWLLELLERRQARRMGQEAPQLEGRISARMPAEEGKSDV
jgi:hypothetical protein